MASPNRVTNKPTITQFLSPEEGALRSSIRPHPLGDRIFALEIPGCLKVECLVDKAVLTHFNWEGTPKTMTFPPPVLSSMRGFEVHNSRFKLALKKLTQNKIKNAHLALTLEQPVHQITHEIR